MLSNECKTFFPISRLYIPTVRPHRPFKCFFFLVLRVTQTFCGVFWTLYTKKRNIFERSVGSVGLLVAKKETFERSLGFVGLLVVKRRNIKWSVGSVGLHVGNKRNISKVCGVHGTPRNKKDIFERSVGFASLQVVKRKNI